MAGMLGCVSDYQVLVASTAGVVLGQLDASSVTFSRVLDDVSEATVVIPVISSGCCEILGAIHTWHHELQVFRAGEYVWSGPVVSVTGGRTEVSVVARDIAALLAARIIHDPLCFGAACGGAPGDLTDIGTAIIGNALEVDGHNYMITSAPTGLFGERLYSPGENAWSDLQEALSLGLDMTVLGRRIVLGAADGGAPFGRTAMLTCEDFLGDLQVEEDGLATTTRMIVLGNGFVGIALAPGSDINGDHPYYGLLETTDSSQPDISSQDQADAAAARLLAARFPPPATLIVPSGSQLAATAPIPIGELVPGALTTIVADCICRPVTSTQVLLRADLTWDASGEKVTVNYGTLLSINSATWA